MYNSFRLSNLNFCQNHYQGIIRIYFFFPVNWNFRINEDLQKLILYLICGLKRVIKYLNDNKSMGKYLRRIVKKHSPTEVDFARINPAELSSVFCSAIKVCFNNCLQNYWFILDSIKNHVICIFRNIIISRKVFSGHNYLKQNGFGKTAER